MATASAITLNTFGERLRQLGLPIDFRPVLHAIEVDVVAETKRNFAESRSPDGSPWAPLAHPRPNSKGRDKPLLDRGMLRSSVTSAFAEGHVGERDDQTLTWGTNLQGAAAHQHGATIVPKSAKYLAIPATKEAKNAGSPSKFPGKLTFRFGKEGGVALSQTKRRGALAEVVQYYFTKQVTIPARPFLGITEEMAARWQQWIEDHVVDQVAQRIGGAA